jgi:hypothetical protein
LRRGFSNRFTIAKSPVARLLFQLKVLLVRLNLSQLTMATGSRRGTVMDEAVLMTLLSQYINIMS